MNGGYWGRLLDVDLTKGTVVTIPLPADDILRKYVGCAGLGLYFLAQLLKPGVRATDPDNPVMIMTGPVTGTPFTSASNWTLVTLNGDLEYAPCVSHGHGYFGARLKQSGYDGIILKGASKHPVYLWIDDDKVELRDATEFWGMDTFEAPRAISTRLGDQDNISVACIGPAGEELLMGASVRTDGTWGASKGGGGIAWGAKKLKAIAVRGTQLTPLADRDAYVENAQKYRTTMKNHSGYKILPAHGIHAAERVSAWGAIPAFNYTDPEWGMKWGKTYGEHKCQWKISAVGSYECDLQCKNETLITTGPCAGSTVRGYSLEVMEDAGTVIGIEDPGTCLVMGQFYDAMGCSPSDTGRLIAMAFEMYNKGILTKEDTGGLELNWGDADAARELFMQILYRQEPLGAKLAKGHKEFIKELGKGSEEMFVHVKGVGNLSHDLRAWGFGAIFSCIVAGAGPTMWGWGIDRRPEPDLGYPEPADPFDPDGKAEACYKASYKKLWEDCSGACWFSVWGVPGSNVALPRALALATGWDDFDWEEAKLVGERVITLMRMIAVNRGMKREHDLDVSDRVVGDPGAGPGKGRPLKPHLARMLDEYYACAGWDVATGIPTAETVRRLGLEEVSMEPGRPLIRQA